MGCSSSKSTATVDDTKLPKTVSAKSTKTKMEYPASEAFTIPLESEETTEMPLNETLRQPPKRIQQMLQEAASSEPPTLEELEDKQQKAEQRRQELMQQKLEIIQKNAQMLMRSPGENPGDEENTGDKEENPENPD
ncbi:uncharacterized protein LOC108053407 [Drosophila rhopaloa]|uniref:Uncharacterized protein LOC108053407 n=1 Tax=Drosophila rhopaloa TaxID=1041015 RepID=A0A6P4G221_DRORH|nr:uncharacterized protein LOC108053407 [Drosophila rhopaloa]XP_016991536.1 uncharacterized protein LOC108053407 [Drosophila rhopaloa]